MLIHVHGAPDEEVLNVVVRPTQAEERIGRLEGMVGCLGELSDYMEEEG